MFYIKLLVIVFLVTTPLSVISQKDDNIWVTGYNNAPPSSIDTGFEVWFGNTI